MYERVCVCGEGRPRCLVITARARPWQGPDALAAGDTETPELARLRAQSERRQARGALAPICILVTCLVHVRMRARVLKCIRVCQARKAAEREHAAAVERGEGDGGATWGFDDDAEGEETER